MKIQSQNQDYVNRNVMEVLVKEEIERQSKRYPSTIVKHINFIEVATYALNRLPALYASSQQGFNRQKLKGRSEYSTEITKVVRRAFAAIQQDLLRYSVPLVESAEPTFEDKNKNAEELKQTLQELSQYLPDGKFSMAEIIELLDLLSVSNLKNLDPDQIKKLTCKSSAGWNRNAGYQK